jgi:D-3-phosphoglycerate dehydrogenase
MGAIAGAALDVTDPQPLPDDHSLWAMPNVIITPHTANPPSENSLTLANRVRENLRRLQSGQELLGVIDPERDY